MKASRYKIEEMCKHFIHTQKKTITCRVLIKYTDRYRKTLPHDLDLYEKTKLLRVSAIPKQPDLPEQL